MLRKKNGSCSVYFFIMCQNLSCFTRPLLRQQLHCPRPDHLTCNDLHKGSQTFAALFCAFRFRWAFLNFSPWRQLCQMNLCQVFFFWSRMIHHVLVLTFLSVRMRRVLFSQSRSALSSPQVRIHAACFCTTRFSFQQHCSNEEQWTLRTNTHSFRHDYQRVVGFTESPCKKRLLLIRFSHGCPIHSSWIKMA